MPHTPVTDFELTTYEPRHLESLISLYRRHFGRWSARRFADRWRWQYLLNPYCSRRRSFIQVGVAGGEVVAHLGAFPLPVRLGGSRHVFLWAADFVADPPYRWAALRLLSGCCKQGQIAGSGLSGPAMTLFRHFGGAALPISKERYVLRIRRRTELRRKIRSRLPGHVGWIAAPALIGLKPRAWSQPNGAAIAPGHGAGAHRIRVIRRFEEARYQPLWEQVARSFSNSIEKTAEYLNWRYIDCPTMSHLCLGSHDASGQLTGVVVAARCAVLDQHGRPCGTNGEILELIATDPAHEATRHLVHTAVGQLDRAGVDEIGATGLHARYLPLLSAFGFAPLQTDRFVAGVMLGSRAESESVAGGADDWYLTAGDGDAVYGTAI